MEEIKLAQHEAAKWKGLSDMQNSALESYWSQTAELRRWLEQTTGVDTNEVIGTDGWPGTFSGCLVQAMESWLEKNCPKITAKKPPK